MVRLNYWCAYDYDSPAMFLGFGALLISWESFWPEIRVAQFRSLVGSTAMLGRAGGWTGRWSQVIECAVGYASVTLGGSIEFLFRSLYIQRLRPGIR